MLRLLLFVVFLILCVDVRAHRMRTFKLLNSKHQQDQVETKKPDIIAFQKYDRPKPEEENPVHPSSARNQTTLHKTTGSREIGVLGRIAELFKGDNSTSTKKK